MNKLKTQEDLLVSGFLHEVQRKLPEWLKGNREEVEDILSELEEHIYDRAMDISDSDTPGLEAVQQAIEMMGSPAKIASSYKQRGTPKYFITEELWPIYMKILILVNGFIIGVVSTVLILFSSPEELLGKLFEYLGGVYIQVGIVTFIFTLVFVFLSKEGYLPENLTEINIQTPKIEIQTTKIGIPTPKIEMQTPRTEVQKTFYNPRDHLLGALVTSIFGFLLVVQRFFPLNHITTNDMQNWMLLLGIILAFDALLELMKLKNNVRAHQVLMIADAITNIPVVGLFLILATTPEMLFSFMEIPVFVFPFAFGFVAIVIAADAIVTIYKAIRLQRFSQ